MIEIFGESEKTPTNFQNVLDKLPSESSWQEQLYLAVLYVFFESGFALGNNHQYETTSFDAQAMAHWTSLPLNEIYFKKPNACMECHLRLGKIGSADVTILGSPSCNSLSEYLIINVLVKKPQVVVSHCFKTSEYAIKRKTVWHLKNIPQLGLLIRNVLVTPIKSELLLQQKGCSPVMQKMPSLVINKVVGMLKGPDKNNFLNAFKEKYT